MANSVIESLRRHQEEIELGEKAISKLLIEKDKRQRHQAVYENAILDVLQKIQNHSETILDIYADSDGMRREEVAFLAGQRTAETEDPNEPQNDVWSNFYDKLKQIKDYHRKFGQNLEAPDQRDVMQVITESFASSKAETLFTPNEDYGRRLDLSEGFTKFVNWEKYKRYRMNNQRRAEIARQKRKKGDAFDPNDPSFLSKLEFVEMDFITFLKTFDRFHDIPRYCKYRDPYYKEYLKELLDYLQTFFKKQNPLVDHSMVRKKFEEDFYRRWVDGQIPEWAPPTHKLPLYCLPTDRLFSSATTLESHQTSKKYQKYVEKFQALPMDEQRKRTDDCEAVDREVAEMEAHIQRYREALNEAIDRTIEHLQKKQSRTESEFFLDEHSGGEEVNPSTFVEESDAESDEERPIYNPLNLPLGFDGRPIPFWLYKLHGLGVEYKCEICGNYSYWGRLAFERHFQEWRHAFGMRCLRIPNTVHFKEITRIEDAIALYEKLKREAEMQAFRNEQDVECEDTEGNVMSAKAYEDLRRQGLL